MQHRIHINIGSNRGHRHAQIERAVAAISSLIPGRIAVSEPYESLPWGFQSEAKFLNVGLMIDAETPPVDATAYCLDLLKRLLRVEHTLGTSPHRNPDGSYADRELDIDLIAVDSLVISTSELTLPHPRMQLRRFVLEPMAYLDPEWRHPLLDATPGELLKQLEDEPSALTGAPSHAPAASPKLPTNPAESVNAPIPTSRP